VNLTGESPPAPAFAHGRRAGEQQQLGLELRLRRVGNAARGIDAPRRCERLVADRRRRIDGGFGVGGLPVGRYRRGARGLPGVRARGDRADRADRAGGGSGARAGAGREEPRDQDACHAQACPQMPRRAAPRQVQVHGSSARLRGAGLRPLGAGLGFGRGSRHREAASCSNRDLPTIPDRLLDPARPNRALAGNFEAPRWSAMGGTTRAADDVARKLC
jgi:hypothetical protein